MDNCNIDKIADAVESVAVELDNLPKCILDTQIRNINILVSNTRIHVEPDTKCDIVLQNMQRLIAYFFISKGAVGALLENLYSEIVSLRNLQEV